jgi:shikimate dehydrogenase
MKDRYYQNSLENRGGRIYYVLTMAQIPSGRTLVYPMIGHPTVQVKSPATFNRYFLQQGMDAVMIAMDIDPAEARHFFSLLRGWQNCPGCLVTVPHKQEAARQSDKLSDRAHDLGAVNVIRRTDKGRLEGDMVDGVGFLEALRRNGFDASGKRAVVFGAGGAGSAIAYALAEAKATALAVTDIDEVREEHLMELIASRYPSVKLSGLVTSLSGFDLAVNATPLGMNGDPHTPFPLDSLEPATLVADVVTEPEETPWLAGAKARGCPTQTGYDMTLGQFVIMGRHMGITFEQGYTL